MSYIEDTLFGTSNSKITDYLQKEGFKKGRNPVGYGDCLYYVAHGDYTVWFSVHDNFIHLYAEYSCGGEVGQIMYQFNKNDMDSFMEAYCYAIDWVKGYI